MKHGMALALVLAMLSPPAALIASVWSAMPCCMAAADATVAAPMPCCTPTMCAAPSPARQPKADTPTVSIVVVDPGSAATDDVVRSSDKAAAPAAFAPAPTRVRLALVATLLI